MAVQFVQNVSKRWYNDPVILHRLKEHERLKRAGLSPADAEQELSQSHLQWMADEKRVFALMQRAATLEILHLRAEADKWYREVIEDADRLTEQAPENQAKAMMQSNKNTAIAGFVKLHGLQKPGEIKITQDTVVRKYIGVELRTYDSPPQLNAPSASDEIIDTTAQTVSAQDTLRDIIREEINNDT